MMRCLRPSKPRIRQPQEATIRAFYDIEQLKPKKLALPSKKFNSSSFSTHKMSISIGGVQNYIGIVFGGKISSVHARLSIRPSERYG